MMSLVIPGAYLYYSTEQWEIRVMGRLRSVSETEKLLHKICIICQYLSSNIEMVTFRTLIGIRTEEYRPHPLMTMTGLSLATLRASLAAWTTLTTSSTSL